MKYYKIAADRIHEIEHAIKLGLEETAEEIFSWYADEIEEADPTPYCHCCYSMTQKGCSCGPVAENN